MIFVLLPIAGAGRPEHTDASVKRHRAAPADKLPSVADLYQCPTRAGSAIMSSATIRPFSMTASLSIRIV